VNGELQAGFGRKVQYVCAVLTVALPASLPSFLRPSLAGVASLLRKDCHISPRWKGFDQENLNVLQPIITIIFLSRIGCLGLSGNF
jgi:hypothetical protein